MASHETTTPQSEDPVENVVHSMPIVLLSG